MFGLPPESLALSLSQLTVLVVDDDDLVRQVVAEILAESDVIVIEAASGAEALQCVSERPDLDVVISDVNMPGIDGLKLMEKAQFLRPNLPVILMSGRPYIGNCDLFLAKPFTRGELIDRIRLSTSERALERQGGLSPPPVLSVERPAG